MANIVGAAAAAYGAYTGGAGGGGGGGYSGDGGNTKASFANKFTTTPTLGFDSSGFNVNFGGLQSNASGGSGGGGSGIPPWVWYAAAAVGVLLLVKHKKL